MSNESMSKEEIKRIREYLDKVENEEDEGEEISKSGFITFLEHMGLHALVKKVSETISDFWDWLTQAL